MSLGIRELIDRREAALRTSLIISFGFCLCGLIGCRQSSNTPDGRRNDQTPGVGNGKATPAHEQNAAPLANGKTPITISANQLPPLFTQGEQIRLPTVTAADDHVVVYGNYPPDNFCAVSFSPQPGVWQSIDPKCNDQTSTVHVPFGMSLTICANDQAGGLSPCRTFLPGTYYVGNDMNDTASAFRVENTMTAYINSADFKSSFGLEAGVSFDTTTGQGGPELEIKQSTTDNSVGESWYIPLPDSCPIMKAVETTKVDPASWVFDVSNKGNQRTAHLGLSVTLHPSLAFAGNDWVGVQLICQPKGILR